MKNKSLCKFSVSFLHVKFLILCSALILTYSCKHSVQDIEQISAAEHTVVMEPVCRFAFYQDVPFEEAVHDTTNIYIMQDGQTMLAHFSCIEGYDFTKAEAYGLTVTCESLGYPDKRISDPRFPLQNCLFQVLGGNEWVVAHISSWEQTINQMVAAGFIAP